MIEKRTVGRPKLQREERLEARYNVRVNVDYYNRITRASINSGTRPEQLIREAIDKHIN